MGGRPGVKRRILCKGMDSYGLKELGTLDEIERS
jgi:hypothetical protein